MAGENSPVAINGGDSQGSQKGAEDRKIFVGGISADVSNEDLQQHFQQFGEVAQAQVKIDRATGRSRGFGFVEFGTVEACRKALNDREQTIKGKTCEIKPAKSRENKKVFVGGLPSDHPEEELRKYFEQFGKVDDVEWPYDKQTKTRRNFAFIVFEEEEATERAVAQPKHTFSDRECDVKKAVPQSRRFNNFRGQMAGGPRGYGAGMPRGQMQMHNAAPWYNGWNQMSNMYAGQSGQHSGGWGDWNASSYGYFQGAAQQGNYGYGGKTSAGNYDYSQNGNTNRGGQNQNGSAQRQGNYQAQY
jgi:RNA recognition motif-containing protein